MTNKQIFKKVILKAEKNRFNVVQYLPAFPPFPPVDFNSDKALFLLYAIKEKILFSHDFAKAFWGEFDSSEYDRMMERADPLAMSSIAELRREARQSFKDWEYHLKKMVLEKEPLKYLEKFL